VQCTSSGNGIPISSNGTHFQYCPFTDPTTSGNFPFGTVHKLAICHYWNWAWLICIISGTGRPISSTGLCAISDTVIHWAPYRNWTLCVWSHFRYRALPVLVRSFIGSRTGTGIYVWSHFRYRALPVPVWSFLGSRTRIGINVRGPISGAFLILDEVRGISLYLCSWLTCARARKRKKWTVNAVPEMWFPTSTGTITGNGPPIFSTGKLRVWVLT
jgi:hypothetical protein